MTDVQRFTRHQDDLVAAWQLAAAGWSRARILHHAAGWRRVHDGVFAVNHAPLSQRQRWMAAVLTAPETYLWGASAGACLGFREWEGFVEVVVRPGSGGPRRFGSLLVCRSTQLAGNTTEHEGIPTVGAPLALVSLAPHLGSLQMGRAFREACRLRRTAADDVARVLAGQRGTRRLAHLCDRYATIPYHRCRSDAESRALEVLHDAGIPSPTVNVRVGRNGPEADLVWRDWRLIVEIDGHQFHRYPDEDARKERAWRAAGYTVRRVSSDDVYFRPEALVTTVNVHRGGL